MCLRTQKTLIGSVCDGGNKLPALVTTAEAVYESEAINEHVIFYQRHSV
jgi:hypothetical protein